MKVIIFYIDNIEKLSGELKEYEHATDFGYTFANQFFTNCGSSVYWLNSNCKGMTGISGETLDPPTFWYEIQNEVFCIKKEDFVDTNIPNKYDELP